MPSETPEIYTQRARIRVCGLCWKDEKLLMVNHRMGSSGSLWIPPGGGVEFSETAADTLVREFREETGVQILPGRFQFVCEVIQPPIHAVELFFEVTYLEGEAITGHDPETDAGNQIITDVGYKSMNEILALPEDERHGIFKLVKTASDLKKLTGFYRI